MDIVRIFASVFGLAASPRTPSSFPPFSCILTLRASNVSISSRTLLAPVARTSRLDAKLDRHYEIVRLVSSAVYSTSSKVEEAGGWVGLAREVRVACSLSDDVLV